MMIYTYKCIDDEIESCESCGAKAPTATFGGRIGGPAVVLCELCATTKAGNAHIYPEQYPHVDVLKTICGVGNLILDAVTKRREKPGE